MIRIGGQLQTYIVTIVRIAPTDIEEKLRMSYKTKIEWQEEETLYRCQSVVPQVGSPRARYQVLKRDWKRKKEGKRNIKTRNKSMN